MQESLDTKLKTTPVDKSSMLHQMGEFSASMIGGSNFSMHHLGTGHGYLIQFDKGGATEFHHVDDSLQGGYNKNSGLAPFKLVSTIKDKVQQVVDSGKPVRVVAHAKLADGFSKLTSRILSKHQGYNQSGIESGVHEITGDPIKSWTINKEAK